MEKIKENFSNNKQTWILIIALVVFIIFVFVIPQIKGLVSEVCGPGELYNRDTGNICPESPAPYVDPATIIPGKG